jgi:hypothetical protein
MTREATDRAVSLWVAVHALEVVALAVVAEQVSKKSSMHQPAPVAVNGLLSRAVAHQVRLNRRFQFALIASIESHEAERLQITRDRLQHLGRATHRSGRSREPQPDAGTKFERFGQTDETTGERNDLQLALPAAAVCRAQSGSGRVREPNAGMEPNRLRWEAHGGLRVCCEPWRRGRLRKGSERYSYPGVAALIDGLAACRKEMQRWNLGLDYHQEVLSSPLGAQPQLRIVNDDYRAITEKSGVVLRPATDEGIGQLQALGIAEDAVAFYRQAEPVECTEIQRIWLC